MDSDFLYKNRKILGVTFGLIMLVLIYGIIVIIDEFQVSSRNSKFVGGTPINSYINEFNTYDVEGLSDEEIESIINSMREEKSSK